jgi:hypothetical protein
VQAASETTPPPILRPHHQMCPSRIPLSRRSLTKWRQTRFLTESHTRHTEYLESLRKCLENCPPPSDTPDGERPPADRLIVEERLMSLGRPGHWGERVADDQAEDGFAIKLFNTHYEWCLQWHVNPTVFEADTNYRLRVRVRVAKTARQGNAFWAGVYDVARKKGWGQIQPTTSAVPDGYQWYDVATWTPEANQYLWIGPGPFAKDGGQSAVEAVYVDRFELTCVPD